MNTRLPGASSRCLALVALTFVAACGPLRRGGGDSGATIIFTNESMEQVTVYVVGPGSDSRRLGTVFAGRTDTLTVPAAYTTRGSVNIVARMLARSGSPQTGSVSMRPGDVYEVRLPPDARMLTFLPAGS